MGRTPMVSEEDFIRLLVAHEGELRAFAYALVPQPTGAEDVLQEATIAMWRKLGSLESEQVFRSWARAYVRFTALNFARRKEARRLVLAPDVVELVADEFERDAGPDADLPALRRCLARLPERQRELVRRYYAETSMTVERLAREVSRPPAGIYKSLQRAREALRDCVKRQRELPDTP